MKYRFFEIIHLNITPPPTKSKMIFRCVTWDGHKVKILSEFLASNIKSASLVVDQKGIHMTMTDQPCKTLVNLTLEAENFKRFDLYEERIILGLNLSKLNQALRCINKRDSLELFIDKDDRHHLNIRTLPRDGSRNTVSSIVIQDLQSIKTVLPEGYARPVVVPSINFQKMCKELANVGSPSIEVRSRGQLVEFIANSDNVIKSVISLGEDDDIPGLDTIGGSDSHKPNPNPDFSSTYTTDQFTRIIKISGLGENLKIYPGTAKLPMMFRTDIGSLGSISVYIKSKELSETGTNNSLDYDSDE